MAKKDAIEQIEIEAPYELPEGWRWKTLGNTCDMYQPKTISTKELIDDGKYLVYGANGVIGRYDKYNHEKAQLLITCRGATCGAVNISEPFSWINGNAMVINPKDENLDLKYLAYIFQSEVNFNKVITGSAQPQITRQSLLPVIFPLPPTLAEQQRIVNRIETMFAKLDQAQEKAQAVLDNFETRKAAILHKAFTGELTANWRKENGMSDDSWEEKTLGEAMHLQAGKNISANKISKENNNTNQYPCFGGNGIRGYVDTFNNEGSFPIIGRQGALCGNLNFATGKFYATEHAVVVSCPSTINPIWAYYTLKTMNLNQYATATAQPGLAVSNIVKLNIFVPSLSEQQEIVRILDTVLEKESRAKEAAQTVLDQIALLKKSILARAFRGEL